MIQSIVILKSKVTLWRSAQSIKFMQAFDRINHNIAIEKLIQLNVNRALLPTICDFLSNRSQTVRYQGSTSCPRNLTCGVPQGTKLGPIIFLIMINDAALSIDQRWKYVDDLTLLVATHKSKQSSMQSHLDSLCNWSRANDLKPKPAKCNIARISFLRDQLPPPVASINGIPLEAVDKITLLGVTIQTDLKWNSQVELMITRASRRLYILCILKKNGVALHDLVLIYKMYIRPILEFGSPVWSSSLTVSQINDIERVQKRVIRCITYPNIISYGRELNNLGLPTLHDRREELLMKFGENLLKSSRHRDILPQTRQNVTHSERYLRNSDKLDIPRCRTQRYKNSTVPCVVSMLNSS